MGMTFTGGRGTEGNRVDDRTADDDPPAVANPRGVRDRMSGHGWCLSNLCQATSRPACPSVEPVLEFVGPID
jgi:hypothetical protein